MPSTAARPSPRPVNFVEKNGRSEALKEAARIVLYSGLQIGIFEQNVLRFRKETAEESGFAGAAGACQYDGGIVAGCFKDEVGEFPRYGSHVDKSKIAL